MTHKIVAVVPSLLLAAATAVGAQASAAVGGVYVRLGGDDFAILEPGVGAEANVLVSFARSFKLGVGAQYSWHGIEGADGTEGVLGVLAEARLQFGTGRATPYVTGRGGWVRASSSDFDVTLDGNPDEVSATGSAFGGGGGVIVALSPGLALDIGAVFHSVSFGEVEVNGTTLPGSERSGTALQIRGGIRFGRGAR